MFARIKLQTWAEALLVLTVLVILWGAFVRVTGSGAGCADHWPLCNGVLIPRAPRMETLIELTHRVTSSLAGLLSIVVMVLALRRTERGQPVRAAAITSFVLMLVEGAIGAVLVKKGLVAKDASSVRALVVGLHLGNTFLLLGAQLEIVYFARGGAKPRLRERPGMAAGFALMLVLVLLVGASGAVTALGDTLFPAASLSEGMRQDLASDAHFLVRLRVWHPVFALITGALVTYFAQQLRAGSADPDVARWSWRVTGIFVAQIALGSLNLVLLAPAWLQVLHLLLADLLWLALCSLALHTLSSARLSAPALAVPESGNLTGK
jgi:cytochrome c oxidase assembly protein subunit 15